MNEIIKTNLKIPKKYSTNNESITNYIIGHVARYLSKRFTFGYYMRADIIQEIWVISLDVMSKDIYNGTIPLENFLIMRVKQRLINLRRDKYSRKTLKEDSRKTLMNPAPDSVFPDDDFSPNLNAEGEILCTELESLIDEYLPITYRQDYLRMREGCIIPEHRRQKIRDIIRDILEENDYEFDV
jgi:hypothetical protein